MMDRINSFLKPCFASDVSAYDISDKNKKLLHTVFSHWLYSRWLGLLNKPETLTPNSQHTLGCLVIKKWIIPGQNIKLLKDCHLQKSDPDVAISGIKCQLDDPNTERLPVWVEAKDRNCRNTKKMAGKLPENKHRTPGKWWLMTNRCVQWEWSNGVISLTQNSCGTNTAGTKSVSKENK